jgi:hypothetical protein
MSFVPARNKPAFQRIALVVASLALIAIAMVGTAGAQPDTILNGNGHDLGATVGVTATSGSAVPNTVAGVTGAVSAGATSVDYVSKRTGTVGGNTAGNVIADFAVNRLVMVYQTIGTSAAPTSGTQTAYPLSKTTAGHWEYARIQSFTGTSLTFTAPLIYSYPAGTSQVIAVPEYSTLKVYNAASTITAPAWDGTSGGVVAILANGQITFGQAATVSANAAGFRGGIAGAENSSSLTTCPTTQMDAPVPTGATGYAMKGEGFYAAGYKNSFPATAASQAGRGNYLNAGGGGNCFNAGGGGGGNGGQGGVGGHTLVGHADGDRDAGGLGGAALTYSAAAHLPLGGGGGAGERNDTNVVNGGAGGGVVMIRGTTMTGAGNFRANGGTGAAGNVTTGTGNYPDGAGGGGAGGVVQLRFSGDATCGAISANGGAGGANITDTSLNPDRSWSGGGGGGGGKTYAQAASGSCTTAGTSTALPGASGKNTTGVTNSFGAGDGATGTTTQNVTPLAAPVLTAISAPANGSTVTTTTPAISGVAGTATNNSTVVVYVDGVFSGSTLASGTGVWSYTPAALSQGSHTVTAYAELDGLDSATVSDTFTVDSIAPAAPTLASNRSGTVTQTDATITYTSAEAGGTMQCSLNGAAYTTCAASGFTISGLTDGPQTYSARQVDAAGNIGSVSSVGWVVDTTPPPAPTVTRTSPASTPTTQTTATITYSANEGGGTLQCSVDGGSFVACTGSPASLTSLTDGPHSYAVRQTDGVGNVGTATTVNWTVDTTPPPAPTVTRVSPASTPTNQTTAQISYSANEAGGTLECSVDGGSFATCAASPANLSSLTAGPHSYSVRQKDALGNTSTATTVNWVVDLTPPPAPTVNSNRTGTVNLTTAQVTYSANEAGGSLECSVDGGSFVACTGSPANLSSLTDGPHSYAVRQIDTAGNTGSAATVGWTVDTSPPPAPTVTRVSPASTPTNLTTAQITYSANEAGGTLQCSVDGGSFTSCAGSPANLSSLTEGAHSYSVRQVDAGTNTGPATTVNWVVDLTAPAAPTITSGPTGSVSSSNASFGFTGEVGATFECYIDSPVVWVSCASPEPYGSLSEGSHTFHVRQTDTAGNAGPEATRTWTVDTIAPSAPSVVLEAPVSSPTNQTTATISYTEAEPGGTLECSVDGGAFTTCTGSPANLSSLIDGGHTYAVRQVDAAGNTGSPASVAWSVDTSAPDAPSITDGPSTTVATTDATFTFSGEPGATFECYIDSPVDWVSCTSPQDYSGLDQGPHTFHVRQTDTAGNTGPEATQSWAVDTVGPPIPSLDGPTGTSASNAAAIDFSDTEDPVTFMCSLDGDTATLCTSPVNLTGLADGPHTYEVYAVDALGNSGDPASLSWTVDSSLFTTSITDGPTGTVPDADNEFSFEATLTSGTTYHCQIDADPVATCSSPLSTGDLPDGEHTFSVYAENGSQTTPTVSRTYTIDTTGPDVAISSPTEGETTAPAGDIVFTATDDTGPVTTTCAIDADTPVSCTSTFAFSGLIDGSHSATVVATDGVGNAAQAVRNFVVDAAAPDTSITDSPDSLTSSTDASFSFESDETGTFECKLDAASFAACTDPDTYSGLLDGQHTFSVRAIDQYGLVDATPATFTWTVDTIAPSDPEITNPAADIVTSDTTPDVSGTAEPNSHIKLYDGVDLIGTGDADINGDWTITSSTLSEGDHVITATSTDDAGNTSGQSNSVTITIDTTDPDVSITDPANAAVLGDNTPDVSFTYNDSNTDAVECKVDNDAYVACVTAWTTPTLDDGPHTAYVRVTDKAGNTATASRAFIVDTAAPSAPVIDTPASDSAVSDLRPTIGGTAEPNSTIIVFDDGTPIGTTTANGSGVWSFTPNSDLGQGAHPFVVTATDEAGNESDDSNTRTLTVDTINPDAPAITDPASDIATSDVRPTLGGTAEANSTVTIFDDGTEIGTTTADGLGAWEFTPTSDLDEGPHPITATSTDAAGNESDASNQVTITVDTTSPDAPEITTPSADVLSTNGTHAIGGTAEAGAVVTVFDDGTEIGTATADGGGNWSLSPDPTFAEGVHPITATATDAAGNESDASGSVTITIDTIAPDAPVIDSPDDGDTVGTDTPTISGTGEPGATIKVYDGVDLLCTATVTVGGTWSCVSATLDPGAHTLTAIATDPAGNEGDASDEVGITVDTDDPEVSITAPAAAAKVNTHTPAISFTVTDDSSVTTECKSESSSYVSCATGWNTPSLADGSHTVSVRAKDAAGNVAVATVTFTVDTTAPTSSITGKPATRDNNPAPTFTFTSNEPGSTFECELDGGGFTACVNPFTTPALTDGTHTFKVRATDPTGNTESPAQSYTWDLDTDLPAKPVITTPAAAAVTKDDTPTISGDAEPNSDVEVFVNGFSLGHVTANAGGHWTITSIHLADGVHSATAQATDQAGNTGAVSDAVAFTVDTTPPGGSIVQTPGTVPTGENPTFTITPDEGDSTITCSLDGAPTAPCSSPYTPPGKLAPGTHTVVVTFTDPAGNSHQEIITFVIAGEPVTPPPVNTDPTQCLGGGVVITNLFPKGNKATISGFARKDLVGKSVTITYNATKKTVATAVVKADGSFGTTFKAPPKKDWNKNTSTYLASAGGFKSKKTKLLRRTSSTVGTYSGGKLTVSGAVTLPLVKGGGATIKAKTGCTGTWKVIGTTKFKSNGAFSFSAPYAGSGVIFVQVNAVIGNPSVKNKKFKTNSFVVPVVVK